MPPSLPGAIGKYTVERFIESGGMGDVYLARDPSLDRPVAIKFLREGFDSDEMRERFEREARAAGRLSHPNIVTIYEFGEFERRPFIAMEFVRGEPLSKLIRRRESIPLVRKLEMMEGLCSGLGHAHKAGIVHRDVKPANLMVDADGPLKILDFGIVRMAGSGLTSHGVLVGTINYMSPEQIAGSGSIDHRSDVFAVGAVLHEVFTYQRAFPGEMADVLYKIVHTRPESAATLVPGLDPGIVRAIDQCLDKAPERRYQDLNVLRRDLARIRQRLELEESETHGHSAVTHRQVVDSPASHPGRPSGTPPSVPPGTPPPRTPAPGTSPSERARRVEEAAAAERARLQAEEAHREREAAEEARLAEEAAEREQIEEAQRAERARFERERAEKEKQRQERARAEQVRAEQARQEQARQEQARHEQARLEAARLEEARLVKARGEEAERARVDRERAEQARLAEARKAREEAERQRAADQQRAREEAARQAEARRLQKRRDLAEAKRLVDAGHFAEAVQLLKPWASESGSDATYNGVLLEAESGVAKLEAERREQEALAHHVAAAAEMLVRQDLAGASRAVQAILKAHPGHPGAQNLEREIVRAVEVRARASSTVERARALFDAQPGDALALLEQFTPPHALVDSALRELRDSFAAREKARLRLERDERRRATIARLTGRAGELARSRVAQGAAAVAVLVLAVFVWRGFSPTPPPVDPVDRTTEDTATPPTAGDDSATPVDEAAKKPADPQIGPTEPVDKPATPVDTSGNKGSTATPPGSSRGSPTPTDPRGRERTIPADPNAGRVKLEGTNAGNTSPPAPTDRPGPGGNATGDTATPDKPAPKEPEPTPKTPDPTPPDPVPPRPRETAPPPPPDPVAVARGEIMGWIASYKAAYRALDAGRVRAMNPPARLNPALLDSASIDFSNVNIVIDPKGQHAALHATVRYENTNKRTGKVPSEPVAITWPMRKINGVWIANP